MTVTVKLTDHTRILQRPGAVTLTAEGEDKVRFVHNEGQELILSWIELQCGLDALNEERNARR